MAPEVALVLSKLKHASKKIQRRSRQEAADVAVGP